MPRSLRRRSNVVLSMVAVFAAVAVVVAGSTLVRQRSTAPSNAANRGQRGRNAGVPTAAATTTGEEAAATTTAVLAWGSAMAAGDADRAWELLGPASQAHFGARSGFAAQHGTADAAYARWSTAKADDAVVMTVPAGGSGTGPRGHPRRHRDGSRGPGTLGRGGPGARR